MLCLLSSFVKCFTKTVRYVHSWLDLAILIKRRTTNHTQKSMVVEFSVKLTLRFVLRVKIVHASFARRFNKHWLSFLEWQWLNINFMTVNWIDVSTFIIGIVLYTENMIRDKQSQGLSKWVLKAVCTYVGRFDHCSFSIYFTIVLWHSYSNASPPSCSLFGVLITSKFYNVSMCFTIVLQHSY